MCSAGSGKHGFIGSMDELLNPKAEVVKASRTGKGNKLGMTQSIYSKHKSGLKDSMLNNSRSKLQASQNLGGSRYGQINISGISSSKGLLVSSKESKMFSPDTTARDFSVLIKGGDLVDQSSGNFELNKTYQTQLATDPAHRLKQKKNKKSGKDSHADDPNKLLFEDYARAPPQQPSLPGDTKFENPHNHIMKGLQAKEARQKDVATFMIGLGRDMEERKIKERRDELKAKINMKVPKKQRLEDFLTDKVI